MENLTGKRVEGKDRPALTFKERWALIRAAFGRYLPPLLLTLLCFTIAALLLYLWLI